MKKGFTLVELIAVIVVIAIISLIAFPIMGKVIEKARKGAEEQSALNYVNAVENYVLLHDLDPNKYPYDLKNNTFNVADNTEISFLDLIIPRAKAENTIPALNSFITVKGDKPKSGTVTLSEKGKVSNAELGFKGYVVKCTSNECNVLGKNNKYHIVYDLNGGQLDKTSEDFLMDSDVTLPTPTLEKHFFKGWYTDNNEKIESSKNIKKSQTLHARWSKLYKVTFNVNTGDALENNVIEYREDSTEEFPDATKANYYFLGWYTEQTGGEKVDSVSDLSDDIELYAHWAILIDNIPASDVKNYIGESVQYKGDSNWAILYVGSEFSTDGQRMYLISKKTRWTGKPQATGSYNNTVLKLSSGANLSAWAKNYNTGSANNVLKTWWMLTASNFTSYLDSNVAEWAIGGATVDLFYRAYNIKFSASVNYLNYNSSGYSNYVASNLNVFGPFSTTTGVLWLAGPGNYGSSWVMAHEYGGPNNQGTWSVADKDGDFDFSPVICLKKGLKMYKDGNKYVLVN